MRPISFAVSGIGPETARQTLASKRNVTNRNRMLFCQQKIRHRARCRCRPLGESFRIPIKVQAPTTKLQRNIKPQKRGLFWSLEIRISLDVGSWGLELV